MNETPGSAERHIAYFITPHGYGHASRAAAVMLALRERAPGIIFGIYTRVPPWFFNMSLRTGFHYHETLTDIGLVQATSMEEDLAATIRALDAFLPFKPAAVRELARQVREKGCEMVVCDIAPLGIAVAQEAGLPSILVENFTWDWIYAGYLSDAPGLAPHARALRALFDAATHHIRTEPACTYEPPADLLTGVVSRKPRTPPAETRRRLGVPEGEPLVMVTMGGIVTQYPFLERLEQPGPIRFLIPGGSDHYEHRGSLVLIPHHSDLYHPDLVEASDVIVGKLGYSTLAEAYAAGIPFVYVPRLRFPESAPMSRFAREVMGAMELHEAQFFRGDWFGMLPGLLQRSRCKPARPNGADQIADYLLSR